MVKSSSSTLLVSAAIGAAFVCEKANSATNYSNQNRVALGRSIINTIDLLKVRSFFLHFYFKFFFFLHIYALSIYQL